VEISHLTVTLTPGRSGAFSHSLLFPTVVKLPSLKLKRTIFSPPIFFPYKKKECFKSHTRQMIDSVKANRHCTTDADGGERPKVRRDRMLKIMMHDHPSSSSLYHRAPHAPGPVQVATPFTSWHHRAAPKPRHNLSRAGPRDTLCCTEKIYYI
jgi:hypothetical protein